MVGEEGFEPTWLSANGFTVRRNNTIVAAPPQAGIQYRQLGDVEEEFELVWVTGVEPAASRSQSARSTI